MIRKYWKYIRFIVIPAMCLLFCGILYTAVDFFSMGMIADWLDKNFTYEVSSVAEDGTMTIFHTFNWGMIKTYLLQIILFVVLLGSWVCLVISDIIKQKYRREAAHTISEYMNRYILQNEPVPSELDSEYSEIFARISEVRTGVRMREQLLQAESQRKNDLITYLAHDLKTPLTSVIGYLTFLRDEPNLSEKLRTRYTDIAFKKAVRLEELTSELFEITRFNLSQIELQKERVNLSLMTEQIAYEFLPMLKEKNLRFAMDIVPDVEGLCDVDKMERIIDNLIRNAISYSYSASEIGITVQKTDTEIIMIFKNYGKTIPKEKLERIFEQFFRLDSSRNSKTGGSGLGLAIAKQLIEAHDGTIIAESKDEMIQFMVTLPVI